MGAYLVERYIPGRSETELRTALARVHGACCELTASGTTIRYLGSTFLPEEESCFCRFESDRADTVASVNQQFGIPYARITPGVAIAPEDFRSHQPIGGTAICPDDLHP